MPPSGLHRLVTWAGRTFVYQAPRERDRCPACDSHRLAALAVHKLQTRIDGRRTGLVSGCEDCGLVFVNPPPSEVELSSMYAPTGEWAEGRLQDAAPAAPPKPGGAGSWPRLFDPIRGELDVTQPPAGAKVLDFGCGTGKFLDVLGACGWETYGIEPALDEAFTRHRRLFEIPATPAFDLVIVHHVLEHVLNPLGLLQQLAASARMGAFMLVAGPRLDTLPVHRDYRYVISRVHVTSYTSTCMMGLLARAGWAAVAPPADEVAIAGGRKTAARMRLVAKRVDRPPPLPVRPLDAAREALRKYYEQVGPAPARWIRMAARRAERGRRRHKDTSG